MHKRVWMEAAIYRNVAANGNAQAHASVSEMKLANKRTWKIVERNEAKIELSNGEIQTKCVQIETAKADDW